MPWNQSCPGDVSPQSVPNLTAMIPVPGESSRSPQAKASVANEDLSVSLDCPGTGPGNGPSPQIPMLPSQQSQQMMSSLLEEEILKDNENPLLKLVASAPNHIGTERRANGKETTNSNSVPPVRLSDQMQSLSLVAGDANSDSFVLLDENEMLSFAHSSQLAQRLGCDEETRSKVVVILGNTGEGKSHTLNETLFDGQPVFQTSAYQETGTLGVWAAYQPSLQLIVLDTEGLQGASANENERTRMLTKVMAIADIVIYKTRAERLPNDMFHFLGSVSKTLDKYLKESLRMTSCHAPATGPTVIISHETTYSEPLVSLNSSYSSFIAASQHNQEPMAEQVLQDRFIELGHNVSAFGKLLYLGHRVDGSDDMRHYEALRGLILEDINHVESGLGRGIDSFFHLLKSLNDKFQNPLDSSSRFLADECFSCERRCQACNSRCSKQLNHHDEHDSDSTCIHKKKYNNLRLYCKECLSKNRRNLVVPKASPSNESATGAIFSYATSGSVSECQTCGVIHRDWEHWTGNVAVEDSPKVVREVTHIWPEVQSLLGTENAARMLVETLSSVSDVATSFFSVPTKAVTGYISDLVRPDYWIPDDQIKACYSCSKNFVEANEKFHHCRDCGQGYCDDCSSKTMLVPHRGWNESPVRVCNYCYNSPGRMAGINLSRGSSTPDASGISKRQYGESLLSSLSKATEHPLNLLKSSTNPAYWKDDAECPDCYVCDRPFDDKKWVVHHCRDCGNGVCNSCSKTRMPVPTRGWDSPVRVCDKCIRVMGTSKKQR